MVSVSESGKAEFRLLYFQPTPETGERACVGVVIYDGGRWELEYDPRFSRARCLAPKLPIPLLRAMVEDAKDRIERPARELVPSALPVGPQLALSSPKQIHLPVTNLLKRKLLEAFVGSVPDVNQNGKADQRVDHRIAAFFENQAADHFLFRRRLSAKKLFGQGASFVPNMKRIALTIESGGRRVLVDGVDLDEMGPKETIKRVNGVTHAFWQIKHAPLLEASSHVFSMRSVAVILGHPKPGRDYRDACDWAAHQFGKEAHMVLSFPQDPWASVLPLLHT